MTTELTADQRAATRPPDLGMSKLTDAELYLRGSNTLLASWEHYARVPYRRSGATVPGRRRGSLPR